MITLVFLQLQEKGYFETISFQLGIIYLKRSSHELMGSVGVEFLYYDKDL